MNDHDYPSHDDDHIGTCTALLHELPPDDFDVDYGDATEFSITNFLISAAVFSIVMFVAFKFL